MNIKKMKLPVIIIAIGVIVAVVSCFLTSIMKEPVIKEHDFEYSVTYKLDGEVKTYEGGFKCSFAGHDGHDDPTLREYIGVHTKNANVLDYISFTVAQKDGVELSIVVDLDPAYLMGDPDKYEYVSGNEEPYLEAVDQEGYGVEVSDFFDAEIISWEFPEPIENSFEFAGFSRLYSVSMLVMLLVGVLTIIACVIFVKKNDDVSYKLFDKLSIIANFVIGIVAISFITVVIFFFPLVIDSSSLMYQIYLCIPALTAFTIAASVTLRRKGFTKSGFFVQFVFPVLFFAEIIVESIIFNLFS
jgi:hypothetical protein